MADGGHAGLGLLEQVTRRVVHRVKDVDGVLPGLGRSADLERRERWRVDRAFGHEHIGSLAVLGGEFIGTTITGPDEGEAGILPIQAISGCAVFHM